MSAASQLEIGLYTRVARVPIVQALRALPGVAVTDAATIDELIALVPAVDALVISDPAGAEGQKLAAALKRPECKVRWIQITSAGVDGLLKHGVPAGLSVTSQGGALAVPVAESAVGMLLGLARRLLEMAVRSRSRLWNRTFTPAIMALEGRTAVIVGMGHIGRAVAKRLRSFDMTIIGVTRSGAAEPLADQVLPMARLHAALALGDCVIVTVALADATRGLFDAAAFAACRPGALFVNVARGEIVDQAALKAALDSGALGGAAIDVTTPEPLPADDPLWSAANLVVCPHTAGAGSAKALQRIAQVVADNAARFGRGEALLNRVN